MIDPAGTNPQRFKQGCTANPYGGVICSSYDWWEQWDEFDLMLIPVTVSGYSSQFGPTGNGYIDPKSGVYTMPYGWTITAWSAPVGNGPMFFAANSWSFFGWDVSAWRAFGRSLFSWKNLSGEFKENGCFRQFAEEAFDPADQLAGKDEAIKATAQSGAYGAATAYAAERGLVVPMRSSVVRGILDIGEVAGEAIALGATIYDEGKALVNEVQSFQSGQCQ